VTLTGTQSAGSRRQADLKGTVSGNNIQLEVVDQPAMAMTLSFTGVVNEIPFPVRVKLGMFGVTIYGSARLSVAEEEHLRGRIPPAVIFDANGLVPAIPGRKKSGEVLMMAWRMRNRSSAHYRPGRRLFGRARAKNCGAKARPAAILSG